MARTVTAPRHLLKDTVHVVIPDTQAKYGVPTKHLEWVSRYVAEKFSGRPNVKIIMLGDHWDMPSLSSYDRKGGKLMEGRRYTTDIRYGNEAWELLNSKWRDHPEWERHFLMGNHEERIVRASNEDAQLEGLITLDDLAVVSDKQWKVHDFLKPLTLDGVMYAHYFANRMTGRALAGQSMDARIKTVGRSFTMGHQPGLWFGRREVVGGAAHLGLVAGSCMVPEHRVLMVDLRWAPLGDLEPGDQVVSFDEEVVGRRSRRYKTGTVLRTRHTPREVLRVELDNGQVFYATPDHRWLTRVGGPAAVRAHGTYLWRPTTALRVGSRIPRPLDTWDFDASHEAGYLAGIYDGEGCLYTRETTGGRVAQLSLSQKPGLVLDRSLAALQKLVGVEGLTHTNERGVASARLRGGAPSIAKMLGTVRPSRLLNKWQPEHLGRLTATDNPRVVSIETAGIHDIVEVDIDHGTMMVEGTPQHNCYTHEEDYLGFQGNAFWRGIVICYDVRRGDYDPKFVSLNSLCKRFERKPLSVFLGRH